MKIGERGGHGQGRTKATQGMLYWEDGCSLHESDRLVSFLLGVFQRDVIAQGLQATYRPVTLPCAIQGLEVVRTQVVVVLVSAQQVIDDHQDTVTDRHNGTLFADAVCQAMVLS